MWTFFVKYPVILLTDILQSGGSGLYGRKGIMNLDKTRRKKNECQILC